MRFTRLTGEIRKDDKNLPANHCVRLYKELGSPGNGNPADPPKIAGREICRALHTTGAARRTDTLYIIRRERKKRQQRVGDPYCAPTPAKRRKAGPLTSSLYS